MYWYSTAFMRGLINCNNWCSFTMLLGSISVSEPQPWFCRSAHCSYLWQWFSVWTSSSPKVFYVLGIPPDALQHGNIFCSESFAIIEHVSLAEVWFVITIACIVLKTEGSSCLHSFIEVLSSSTDVRSVSAVHFLRKIRPSFSGATHCIPIIHGHICRCWMMYVRGSDVSIF